MVEGVLAEGEAAIYLAQKLVERSRENLSGVRFAGGLVILGPAEDLPWVDGAIFLGRPSALKPVYLPTHREPQFPLEWMEGALRSQCPPPWVLLEDGRVVGLGKASAVEIELLDKFLADASA